MVSPAATGYALEPGKFTLETIDTVDLRRADVYLHDLTPVPNGSILDGHRDGAAVQFSVDIFEVGIGVAVAEWIRRSDGVEVAVAHEYSLVVVNLAVDAGADPFVGDAIVASEANVTGKRPPASTSPYSTEVIASSCWSTTNPSSAIVIPVITVILGHSVSGTKPQRDS